MKTPYSNLIELQEDNDVDAYQEKRLARLLEVFAMQAKKMESSRTPLMAKKNNFDMLLGLLKSDMEMVRGQRNSWSQQWQDWLNQGGALKNGRSFSSHHVQLTELENLLEKHRTGIEKQKASVQEQISKVNKEIFRCQKKIEHIKSLQKKYAADKNQVLQRRENGQSEERVLAQWFSNNSSQFVGE